MVEKNDDCEFPATILARNASQRTSKMECALKAVLMFHSGKAWDNAAWKELTGKDEATTKSLCDFVREALEK